MPLAEPTSARVADGKARYQHAGALVAALETARLSLLGVAPAVSTARSGIHAARGPVWWWRFHLLVATVAHALMVIPAWQFLARLPGPPGRGLFLSLLVLDATTGIMRLHLRFMAAEAPADRAADPVHPVPRPQVHFLSG